MGVKLRTNLICEGKNAPAGLKCCVFNTNNAEVTEILLDAPGILRVLSGELCVLGSISQSSHRIEVLPPAGVRTMPGYSGQVSDWSGSSRKHSYFLKKPKLVRS